MVAGQDFHLREAYLQDEREDVDAAQMCTFGSYCQGNHKMTSQNVL